MSDILRCDFTNDFGSSEIFKNPIFYFCMSYRNSHKEIFGTSFEKFCRFDFRELTIFGWSSHDEFHNITMDISEGFRMIYIIESTILRLYGDTFFAKEEFSFSMDCMIWFCSIFPKFFLYHEEMNYQILYPIIDQVLFSVKKSKKSFFYMGNHRTRKIIKSEPS